jgi:hypothetical protein
LSVLSVDRRKRPFLQKSAAYSTLIEWTEVDKINKINKINITALIGGHLAPQLVQSTPTYRPLIRGGRVKMGRI